MKKVKNPLSGFSFKYPIIIVFIFFAVSSAFVIVDSGHVGVVRRLGAVQPTPFAEGLHFKRPFIDKIEQIDVRLTKAVAKSQAASRDLQKVSTQVTLQYSLVGAVAPLTYISIYRRTNTICKV